MYSRALHVEHADLAVAALADHLATGQAVATVTGAGTGVGATGGAGLAAALLTHLTLQKTLLYSRLGNAALSQLGNKSIMFTTRKCRPLRTDWCIQASSGSSPGCRQ